MTAKSILFGARRANGTIPLVRNSIGEEVAQQFSPQSLTTIAPLGSMANGQRDKAARRRGRSRRGFIPVAIFLAWFALSPARAVSPAPDGFYPGFNTAEGRDALRALTTGLGNTALGDQALLNNTTGGDNTAAGGAALSRNTTGFQNTATGNRALFSNTTGFQNTATGNGALFSNTTGGANTANGFSALSSNTTGGNNTANGFEALNSNTNGCCNTATGGGALLSNTTGNSNTANGLNALFSNTTGFQNTANGFQALLLNTTGSRNTATGFDALFSNTTGSRNIALGRGAGQNLTTGNENIDIGNNGVAGESNTIRIGTNGTHTLTNIAGIRGSTVAGGVGVIIGADGRLGTIVSSARFKDQIKPMGQASEAILALKPVTFRYKHKLDPEGIPQFGLVAEQVEKVNPDLVARDNQGKVNTVRYEAVNAMLLNEFLKEHRKVQELEAAIARQQKDFAQQFAEQQKEIKALAASAKVQALQIQKLSGRREVSNPAARTATGG